jgi:hypothetical protein
LGQRATKAVIEGSVSYNGPARGNVVLFLFEADKLPPPEGTSRPINFLVVPREQIFRGNRIPHTAEFTIPLVEPGKTYQLRGFLDADGDFSPFIDTSNQITWGDVGGGHFDVDSLEQLAALVAAGNPPPFRAVRVPTLSEVGGDFSGLVVTGVNVLLASTAAVERPIFTIDPAYTKTQQRTLTGRNLGTTKAPNIATKQINVPVMEIPGDFATPQRVRFVVDPIDNTLVKMNAAKTVFTIGMMDLNHDGEPDNVIPDNQPDLFPRILLTQMDDAATPTEIQAATQNGQRDKAVRVRCSIEDEVAPCAPLGDTEEPGPGFRAASAKVVIPTIPDGARYLPFLSTLRDQVTSFDLHALILPTAILSPADIRGPNDARGAGTLNPTRASTPLDVIPPGRYALNVINATGQTWRLPSPVSPQNGAGPIAVPSQGVELVVTRPAAPPPAGIIQGCLSYTSADR